MASEKQLTRRVILVDDEPAALDNLQRVLADFDELEIIAQIRDGETAIASIIEHKPDIVFLDIEMPGVNGFEVASRTARLGYQLVFVTAYDRYALDAFNTNAIDYLLKPVRPSLLRKCIRKMLYQEGLVLEALSQQTSHSDNLVLSDGSTTRTLSPARVRFIEGIGRYRRIHLDESGAQRHGDQTIISETTLDEFEATLDNDAFVRLHRSYIVNLAQVVRLFAKSRRHYVQLAGVEMNIPVSRAKVAEVKGRLQSG